MRLSINFTFALGHFQYCNVCLTCQREGLTNIIISLFLHLQNLPQKWCANFNNLLVKYMSRPQKNMKKQNEKPSLTSAHHLSKINCCNLCTFNLARINLSVSATTLVWRENCPSTQPGNGWTRELNRFIFDFSGSLTPLCKSSMKHLTCQIETNRK